MNGIEEKKKLRILVIFNSLMSVVGGGSRHILEVTDYWCKSCEVDFLISKYGYKAMTKSVQKKPSRIILYSTPFDNSKNKFLVYTSRIIKTILIISKLKGDYDVIIAPNYLPQNMIPAVFLKRKKTKLVVYFHTVQPALRTAYLKRMNSLQRFISIINWEICVFFAKIAFNLLFVVNNATKKYFIEKGFSHKKIEVVDNAIPYNTITNTSYPKKKYDGVFLSRLVKRKGVWDLINIWKIVLKVFPSAKLCIIGDGPEKDKLKLKIENEGLSENITLIGEVIDEKKFELLKKSKIFIFPSYYESWGIVIAEAIACKLPVVTYYIPIYEEVFNAYLFTVKMGDVDGMAKKIIDIINHPQEYETIIQESNKFISKFDWEAVAKQELSDINNILDHEFDKEGKRKK